MIKLNLSNLQHFAHKKGGGSTSNGRDSQAKR
ncbi:TPA: 50S ribosomal protein L27, partial [Streptococcus equi subsp. equi]|nr:50S ribosomal protein L27 [Streptococcus equi subsp. equi]